MIRVLPRRLDMTLRTRLLLGYGIVLAVALLGFFLTLISVTQLGHSPEVIVGKHYPSVLAAERMKQTVQIQQNAIMRRLLDEDYGLAGVLEHTRKVFDRWLGQARQSVSLPEEPVVIDEIETQFEALQALLNDPERWSAGSYSWEESIVDGFNKVVNACDELGKLNFEAMNKANHQARDQVRAAIIESAVIAGCTLLIGIGLALRLSRRLSTPMEALAGAAQKVAGGDYDVWIAPSPVKEIGQLGAQFNEMTGALKRFETLNIEQVVNEQQRSEAVLQSIDDGLVIFDRNGRVVRINQVAARQLAIDPNKTQGHETQKVLAERQSLVNAVKRCLGLSEGESRPPNREDMAAREIVLGSDYRPRYLEYSVLPMRDKGERGGESGEIQGAVLVLRDITDHKAFEQMRTEFVMRASHELRTPVTSIRMGVGMLSERSPFAEGSREHELWETVNEELKRLMELVNDLFDLSRFQAGRQELNRVDCEIGDLLGSARQRFELPASDKHIELAVDCANEDSHIEIDRALFDRVLDNLVGNALRHTPEGGRVALGARQAGRRLILKVADTGSGVDAAQRKRIFEPFVQASERSGGAGLGLSICKEIVQLHGGQIALSGGRGEGATFTISLPV
ncbi:MAG: ATP-binding protein [Gammaproteobacteria bacterium]